MSHDIAHQMCKESHTVLYTGVEGSHMVCTKKGKNGKFTVESWIASIKSHTSVVCYQFVQLSYLSCGPGAKIATLKTYMKPDLCPQSQFCASKANFESVRVNTNAELAALRPNL